MTNGLLVPDVLDETTASAQRKLEAVGLQIGTISTEKNPGGPRHIVETLHREMLKALKMPNVEDKLARLGLEPMVMTPRPSSMRMSKPRFAPTRHSSTRPGSK
jgi:hypothetical protein